MRIIDRIDKLIVENQTTGKEVANAIGISPGNITDWRKDRAKPSSEVIAKLARYFKVPTDYLLGITDSPYEDNDLDYMIGKYGDSLTEEEKQMIVSFLRMDNDEKGMIIRLTNDIIKLRKK